MITQETLEAYVKGSLIPLADELLEYVKSKHVPAADFHLVCMQYSLHALEQCREYFIEADDVFNGIQKICNAIATEEAERRADVRDK